MNNKNILDLNNIKKIHFIGIGGICISGIAKIFLKKGYIITGSDIIKNNIIKDLDNIGIKIYIGHNKNNIYNSDIIIFSSAIKPDNVEILEAINLNIPILSRGEILNKLTKNYYSICIAGSHGKTTITSIISFIFINSGYNITFLSGGILKNFNSNYNLGNSKYFVIESDESDSTFLKLNPSVSIISNIDNDHLIFYNNDFNNLKNSFIKFINNVPKNGLSIICIDNKILKDILYNNNFVCKIITYGFDDSADVVITEYFQYNFFSKFLLKSNKYKDFNFSIKINYLPGKYNALNITASVILTILEGIDHKLVIKSLLDFKGINRRFEILKYKFINKNLYNKKIFLISDYGHHPSEINSVIQNIRLGWSDYKIIMIFQPHRYTRTNSLLFDFIKILIKVDYLILLDIFSAGEDNLYNISSKNIFLKIKLYKKNNIFYLKNINNISNILNKLITYKNIILIQGAGNINDIILNNLNL
ncbi:UDP-N-acetylmuramate--L-alanine ligase [endosymbiont of Pachyrhynchus infernalis]|uniref:UDP-N-acetylmuramate--L-alanine ligase n=1 Tax=endosymbiont of Pachyrhynchus infernalis TaxID=1971488 RepID=UPI000DC6F18B|nr:UDP-N-acetylmuramate--L-alanine ligase [endosymbiont of Pachyrhynchus infernalis]BBA84767.1 UDP-N-acetylmuramate--L-alanine ligase [endosymbiont of Pachyrhynchus infernalis]